MNLKRFDSKTLSNSGMEVQLSELYTGEPSGVFIKVLGMDSDEFRRIKSEGARLAAERSLQKGTKTLTDEEVEQIALDSLAKMTIGWRTRRVLVDEDGPKEIFHDWIEEGETKLEFSQAEAKRVYEQYPAIREQVNRFIGDRRNFLKA